MDLVIRMSYGYGKKHAFLRKSDFQQVGVGKNHIKAELDHLQASKVLQIDGDIIQLNKNYDEWRVNLVKGFTTEKYNEILRRNLSGESIPEIGTLVPETGTKKVPKTGTDTASKPSDTKASEASKDILKKSKDKEIDRSMDGYPEMNLLMTPISKMLYYIMTKGSGTIASNMEEAALFRLLHEDKIPPADIKEGITVASNGDSSVEARSMPDTTSSGLSKRRQSQFSKDEKENSTRLEPEPKRFSQDVADPDSIRWNKWGSNWGERQIYSYEKRSTTKNNTERNRGIGGFGADGQAVANTNRAGSQKCHTPTIAETSESYPWTFGESGSVWSAQSRMGGDIDGFSDRLDRHRWPTGLGEPQHDWEPPRVATGVKNRVPRLKALGNAVVPA